MIVSNIAELKHVLEESVLKHAEVIVDALGHSVIDEVVVTSNRVVVPSMEKMEDKTDSRSVRVFVSAANKEEAVATRKEEVLGTRPFAKINAKLQSKAAALRMLKNHGVV